MHMSRAQFDGTVRKRVATARVDQGGPRDFRGTRTTGRVARLLVGRGQGFIRLVNEREVFFHRADMEDGTPFNELHVGAVVTFELFEDAVSGDRALHVARRNA
jgi:cold shock CspA family protein